MRVVLALALLLAAPLAGCTALQDAFDKDPPPERRTLVSETLAFDTTMNQPSGPPSGPGDLAQRFNVSFDVPQRAQNLNMTVVISFADPVPPDPLPAGEVTVTLRLPDDRAFETTRDRPGSVVREITSPPAGSYSITVEALGRGSADATVKVLVPFR